MLCMLTLSIHSIKGCNVFNTMSMQSTQSNYNVDSNTKYSIYMKLSINTLNYNKI